MTISAAKNISAVHMADEKSLDVIYRNARTYNHWLDKAVDDAVLMSAYDLAKMAPTSANSQPMRLVFVKSKQAKEKLRPCLSEGNLEKTMNAPVTAIIAYDMEFYEKLPQFFPHTDARSWFAGKDELIKTTAFRNGSLQGAYFILAARAVGLDCGPMSGFDNAKVDAAFFAGTAFKSNFLCNLGYGDGSKLQPRSPRPEFSETCRID